MSGRKRNTARKLMSEFDENDMNITDIKDDNNTNIIDVSSLRALIKSSMHSQMYRNAIFFADKLVSITNDHNDIRLLCESYLMNGDYQRAVLFLRTKGLLDTNDLYFKFIAARCLAESNEWKEAVNIMSTDDNELIELLEMYESQLLSNQEEDEECINNNNSQESIKLTSSICLLRAKAYQALENHQKTIYWLQESLIRDCRCIEAFELLIDNRNLKYNDEIELMKRLVFPPKYQWLKILYEAKIEVHHFSGDATPVKIKELETSYNLNNNLELKAELATYYYQRNQYDKCYSLTVEITRIDPYHHGILPVHMCVMVELGLKSELFYCAHQLVDAHPEAAISWYGVGCYYYLIGNYDYARRYFHKATSIDRHFAPAWIGVGHSFSALDESDQAMSAYRTASRLFGGSHIPLLCIGMEYVRSAQNQMLAQQFFTEAHRVCPVDPMIYNEMGVVSYNENELDTAIHYFTTALQQMPNTTSKVTEAILINLGHTYRKLEQFENAIETFEKALGIAPNNAATYTAIGLIYHVQGDISKTIDYYHKALGLHPGDTFTSDALAKAFREVACTNALT